MSRDVKYLLHYEPQLYLNGFPGTTIVRIPEKLSYGTVFKITKIDDFDYVIDCNRTDDNEVYKLSKCDQMLYSATASDIWKIYEPTN